jgi:hypothetical protein
MLPRKVGSMSSPGSTRGNPSMGDIIRSMAVIGLIVLGLYGFGKLFTQEPESPTPAIDYATIVDQARPAAKFELLAPSSLPKGWQANGASLNIDWWHLGVVTDDDEYIGLEQVTSGTRRAVERFADGSKADGTAEIDGETWSIREGPQDRTTYVRREAGVTTLVVGTTSRSVIEKYISSLSTS